MPIQAFYDLDSPPYYVLQLDQHRYIAIPKSTVSNNAAGAEYLEGVLQSFCEESHLMNTYDLDDPVRDADPALPYLFWVGDGTPSTTYVITRPILCTVVWDGSKQLVTFKRLIPISG